MFPDVMAATGAALIGRRISDVGDRMADQDNGEPEPGYDAGRCSSSPTGRRPSRSLALRS